MTTEISTAKPTCECGRPIDLEDYRTQEPMITVNPAYYSGLPCIRWRLSTDQFAETWWRGVTLAEIEANWPNIRKPEIVLACWYEAKYGRRTKRNKAWAKWADEVQGELWHLRYDVPMPPQRAETA